MRLTARPDVLGKRQYFALDGIRTLDHPTCILVNVLTEL